jgi:histidinol-phosphate/aromatic aminotransferase/cobyric acid decarboxylase-like protein
MTFGHGGNIYQVARQFNCRPSEIIDLSSNINPLGSPPGLLAFFKENFILFKLSGGLSAHTVWRHLAEQSILIRNCNNFHGLSDQFVRISLKTPETNRLIGANLRALVNGGVLNSGEGRMAC